jgi:exodeoxyribonuclease VII small subunit
MSKIVKKKRPERDAVSECFEESLAELESIVGRLESGSLSLAEALERYEQCVKHLSSCQRMLERAERRIELLSGVDANGNPITRPFDDAAADSLEEKSKSRGKRRSSDSNSKSRRTGSVADGVDDLPGLF